MAKNHFYRGNYLTRLKIHSVLLLILGNRDQVGLERYFVTITCLVTAVFLLLLTAAHLVLDLGRVPVIIAGVSSLVVAVFYCLARFSDSLFIPKLSLTLYGLVMLDLAWYHKYLSNGPVLFFILVYGALIIWVWENKSLFLLLLVYFLNLAVLFVIEITSPYSLLSYPDYTVRSFDIFLSLTMLSAF
jgi:hypothetical protein